MDRPQEGKTLEAEREPLARDAQDYLFSLGPNGIRLGLHRVERALDDLGRPERHLRVLLVAGTNGKGSTCPMAASALRAAGYRVGLYISYVRVDIRAALRRRRRRTPPSLGAPRGLRPCGVAIVVAGMEGALPSVAGGLVSIPVIAVPTSVGYEVTSGCTGEVTHWSRIA